MSAELNAAQRELKLARLNVVDVARSLSHRLERDDFRDGFKELLAHAVARLEEASIRVAELVDELGGGR